MGSIYLKRLDYRNVSFNYANSIYDDYAEDRGDMHRYKPFLTVVILIGNAMVCPVEAQEKTWDWAALLGSVTVEQTQWQRLDVQPHIRSGNLEAVLDLELFWDETGRLRDRGWDFSTRRKGIESVLRKIYYVRYGDPDNWEQKIYVRLGALESVTLGTGLLMHNYRNTQNEPGIKRTGFDLQLRHLYHKRVSVRAMVSDLLDIEGGGPLVGGHAVFHLSEDWDLGFSVVVDTDQLHALPDSVRAGQSRDVYGAISGDVTYPLIQRHPILCRYPFMVALAGLYRLKGVPGWGAWHSVCHGGCVYRENFDG